MSNTIVSNKYQNNHSHTGLSLPMLCFAMFMSTALVIGLVYFVVRNMDQEQILKTRTYILGKADKSGYIGAKITYDIEPVDITIHSPTERTYTASTPGVYYKLDEEEKSIVLLADSNELGTWSVSFNTKENTDIDYAFIQTPSSTLYLTDTKIVTGEDGQYYLELKTTTSENQIGSCYMTLDALHFSYNLGTYDIPLNEKAEILLQFPEHVFTDKDYTLSVSVQSEEGTTVHTQIPIHLDKKETEENTESTEDATTDDSSESKSE